MNEWLMFLNRVRRFGMRLLTNVRLLLYFVLTICIFGALGAWIPVGQLWFGSSLATELSVHRNLATYVIGIAITALADCIVRTREEDDGAFRLFLLGLTVFTVICAVIVLLVDDLHKVEGYSMAGAIIAALVWLMVNDAHPDLTSSTAHSAIGGEM